MIGVTLPRGTRVDGLIWYLFGPGKANEHVNPRIVAGWRHPADLEPPVAETGRRDFRRLTGLLKEPLAAFGSQFDEPIWHCAIRAAPEDPELSDDQWAHIAHAVMDRTGLAPYGQEDAAVRWIAIHHGDNHIHLVATLARQDGRRVSLSNERLRIGQACREIEQRYGLRILQARDRTAARRPSRAETEQTRRRQWEEVPRIALKRRVSTAAAGAASEGQFFESLSADGVLVRKRLSTTNPGQVTGYAVALDHHTTTAGEPIWYGGGKLAPDLTLPRLRRRWQAPATGDGMSRLGSRAALKTAVFAAAGRAGTEDDFFARLADTGLLVRKRFSEIHRGEVTGYAVSMPELTDVRGRQIWVGGGKLAAGLSLPALRRTWPSPDAAGGTGVGDGLAAGERDALYVDASWTAARAADAITSGRDGGDASWAAADVLHAAARALDNPGLREAAAAFDRAARQPYGRIPSPTPAGTRLRTTARLLTAAGLITGNPTLAMMALIGNLAALAVAVADLRELQGRVTQADAARDVAVRLRAGPVAAPAGIGARSTRGQAALAGLRQAGEPRSHQPRIGPPTPRSRRPQEP